MAAVTNETNDLACAERYPEYRGMSYMRASMTATALIRAAGGTGDWYNLPERLAALRYAMRSDRKAHDLAHQLRATADWKPSPTTVAGYPREYMGN